MKHVFTLLLVAISLCVSAQDHIRLNQLGFLPQAQKIAVVTSANVTTFEVIRTSNNEVVHSGTLSTGAYWTSSRETVRVADFSALTKQGSFKIKLSDGTSSHPFIISDKTFSAFHRGALKAFYFNRSSTALEEAYAGVYKRPMGHPDDRVVVHPSAASASRPAGTIISTPKGWYDAGDYNKYIVNSGISTFTLLSAYESYATYYDTLEVNIPESGNAIPDILDEALWNIEWMATMQDPEDGGVYNKTTHANFDGIVMPAQSTATRYVVAKGTAATLDFAAIMAMTARIYADYRPEFAATCLEQAKLAWEWAQDNPSMAFNNPGASGGYPAVNTGGYGDGNFTDEFFWAAAELFITTGDETYLNTLNLDLGFNIPWWGGVQTLGLISLSNHLDLLSDTQRNKVRSTLLSLADQQANTARTSPYRIPPNDFNWGSNSAPANSGMVLMSAFRQTKDVKYFNAALSALDYLAGRNATTYCFVTGFGSKSPMDIHHRQSAADNIAKPVPGFLAGGPNPQNTDDCGRTNYPSTNPAQCYLDDWCSYSTNEVTINWNAPLVYLTGAVEATYMSEYFVEDDDAFDPDEVLASAKTGQWLVYPNPATSTIRVQAKAGSQIQSLTLLAMDGTAIQTVSGQREMDISQVKPGLYVVKITDANGALEWQVISKQ